MTLSPWEYNARAQAAESQGNWEDALRILADGVAAHPSSAELYNSFGSLALRAGQKREAVTYFERAMALNPTNFEFGLNLVIALGAFGANLRALELARSLEPQGCSNPRYWSARANVARATRAMSDAAESYDRCLQLDPAHPRGLHGRARCALERGEYKVVEFFDKALAVNQGEADLWLGKVQSLDAAGETDAAIKLALQLVERVPHWTEVLRLLAQLRFSCGDRSYDSHFVTAAAKSSNTPVIPHAHIQFLASLDEFEKAAEVAGSAAAAFPREPWFRLAEATNAGMAGDSARAASIFDNLDLDTAERWLQEGRHHLRNARLDQAEPMLSRVLESPDLMNSAYALLGILWRLTDDPRSTWLHGQKGLIQTLPLRSSEAFLSEVVAILDELHDYSSFPVGQSLRGGTQTRHILFMRQEPALTALQNVIENALEEYRSGLPTTDEKHPLLRHRDENWALAGSWSVRLSGGGDYHVPHIHPQGMLSSALYLVVPSKMDDSQQSGWLELGRPPADLNIDLAPLQTIRPRLGQLALFPSTLYHGTRPFTDDKRMTVAFDVIPQPGVFDETR